MKQQAAARGLSAWTLKLTALAAMLIDHLAWVFLPQASWQGILAHTIGAMAMPVFTFFSAEGYAHTRSVSAYAKRLALFALFSYLPFVFFAAGIGGEAITAASFTRLNMLYTLLLALAALWVWDHVPQVELRLACVALLCLAAIPGDGAFFPVLLALAFRHARTDRGAGFAVAVILCFIMFLLTLLPCLGQPGGLPLRTFAADAGYRLGQLPALALLGCYRGRRGPPVKWLFYGVYPLHLALLSLVLWLR